MNKAIPQKRHFRQRAHANPLADHDFSEKSISPAHYSFASHYPKYIQNGYSMDQIASSEENTEKSLKKIEFVDVGCGYGGLLVSLSPLFPETLILGMEIRVKVEDYVKHRIEALRESQPEAYQNISVMRMNAMKYIPNFFEKGQLSKMFFLFPDPHFKKRKQKARIITATLLSEYAYVLKVGGILYTCTDVLDLHHWMVEHLDQHPLFKRMTDEELKDDVCIKCVMQDTEEGKKVERNSGSKYLAVYKRVSVDESFEWNGFAPIVSHEKAAEYRNDVRPPKKLLKE